MVRWAKVQEVDFICSLVAEELRAVVRRMLEDLFPQVYAALHNTSLHGSDFYQRWISEKRVCIPEFFRTATTWGLAEGMITNAEVGQLSSTSEPDVLRTQLLAYQEDPRAGVDLKTVVNRLGDLSERTRP